MLKIQELQVARDILNQFRMAQKMQGVGKQTDIAEFARGGDVPGQGECGFSTPSFLS